MRKFLGTIAAILATVVSMATASDAGWDSQGDRSARSLPGSDHAAALAYVSLAPSEERSRG